MALTLLDVGADQILKSYFNKTQPAGGNNLTLKLFTNNVTPSDAHTASNYTEASGGGYAAKTLTAGSFTVTPRTIRATPSMPRRASFSPARWPGPQPCTDTSW
jgi:hypothetical protein